MPRRARPDRQLERPPPRRTVDQSGGQGDVGLFDATGSDLWVPGSAGGDHGVQMSQDRAGDHGLGLGRGDRRVQSRSPPSRSRTTLIAAAHVLDRNGCRAVSSQPATRTPTGPGSAGSGRRRPRSAPRVVHPGGAAEPTSHQPAQGRSNAAAWSTSRSGPRPCRRSCRRSGPRLVWPRRSASAARTRTASTVRPRAGRAPATDDRSARTRPSLPRCRRLSVVPLHAQVRRRTWPERGQDPAPRSGTVRGMATRPRTQGDQPQRSTGSSTRSIACAICLLPRLMSIPLRMTVGSARSWSLSTRVMLPLRLTTFTEPP